MGDAAAAAIDVLAAGVAIAAARRPAGPAVCVMSLTVLAVLSFTFGSYHAPEWVSLLGAAACAVVLAAWFAVVVSNRRWDGGDDGGLGVSRRGPEPEPTDGGEPWWWPEFERELRAYTRTHEHGRPRPLR